MDICYKKSLKQFRLDGNGKPAAYNVISPPQNRYSLRTGSNSGQADRGRGSGTALSMMERGATQGEARRLCKISTPKLCQAVHSRNI